jgi:hypothetical protein
MALYFASNRLGQFGASSSAITEVLTAGRYDDRFVQSAIEIPAASAVLNSTADYVSAPVGIDATSVTSIYTTVDFYLSATGSGRDHNLMSWVNTTGQVVMRLYTTSGNTVQIQYWNGSAYVAAGPTFSITGSGLYTLNTRMTCGASGSADVWLGTWGAQALVAAVLPTSGLNAAVNNVAAVRFHNPCASAGQLSEIALADFDLRAYRVASDVANGAGTFNDGTGTFADTNATPRDLTTARVIAANGSKFSMTKASRSVPGNMQIDSVVINSAARAQGGVVTNARPGLEIGGVWYPFSDVNPVPNGGYENRAGYILVSPTTGLRMTSSEYNSARFGLEART